MYSVNRDRGKAIAGDVCLALLAATLAHAFATTHHPRGALANEPRPPAIRPGTKPEPDFVAGREVYLAQNCSSCHSIAAEGNIRHPLDDVGSRRNREELREWITATGQAAVLLPPAVAKRKERYRSLSPVEMEVLIAYLASLTSEEAR